MSAGLLRSAAQVSVAPGADAVDVRPDAEVRVSAANGHLRSVVVRSEADGAEVAGTYSAGALTWTARPGLLPLGASFVVEAQAVDAAGQGKVIRTRFRTVVPKQTLTPAVTPVDGQTVGVGMPVMVRFNADVPDRAAVQRALSVTTSRSIEGAWRWFGDREVHWRPREMWPAGTDVQVRLALAGVDAGEGLWGAKDRVVRFHVGDARVHTVDIARHTMTVTRNGQVLRTIPITTGKPGFATRNGIKVIVSKERYRVMDSTTVDIPAGSSESYRLKVEYAMRLTWSGEFIHAAPWSVRHQGRTNVSHGCTGMSDGNAAWLYSISRPGDVVRYVGGTRGLETGNGYTDWNVGWDRWLADA